MDRLQLVSIAVSLGLLGGVLELVRRKKLTEEYSFVWIVGGLALLALSFSRELLDRVAIQLGIHYPPAALLLLVIVFVFVVSVLFSVVVSRQRQQIERLIEDTALLDARLRELDADEDRRPDRGRPA